MNPILFILAGGIVTLVLCVSILLSFVYGIDQMVGYWFYFIGWLLVGHGWQIGALNINVLLIWVIAITFYVWAGVRFAAKRFGRPIQMIESFLLWTFVFLVIVVFWHIVGYSLMFLATDFFLIDTIAIEWFLEWYDQWDYFIDTILALPTIVLLYFFMVKFYWKYRNV